MAYLTEEQIREKLKRQVRSYHNNYKNVDLSGYTILSLYNLAHPIERKVLYKSMRNLGYDVEDESQKGKEEEL